MAATVATMASVVDFAATSFMAWTNIVVVSFALEFGICIDFPCFTSTILNFSTTKMVAFKSMVILEVSFATIEEIFSDTSIVVTFKAYFGFAQN